MKNRILYGFLAAAAAMTALVSCTEKQTKESQLIIDQQVLEFGEDGGDAKVTYTLLNSDGTSEITLSGTPEWISEPVTSVSGEITFTVEPNTGNAREAQITVACGSVSGEFLLKQDAFLIYPTAEQISGKIINTTWCQFYEDETVMYKYNLESNYPMTDANGDFIKMTAGEWAQDFIDKYNADNPDSPATVDELMGYDFTEIINGEEFYLYITTTMDNVMDCWYGSRTEYGDAKIRKIYGEYTYDESTGTMTIEDVGNTNYTRTVVIQFRRLPGNRLEYQITQIEFPYMVWIEEGDSFPLMLSDYDDPTVAWMPAGKMTYVNDVLENV